MKEKPDIYSKYLVFFPVKYLFSCPIVALPCPVPNRMATILEQQKNPEDGKSFANISILSGQNLSQWCRTSVNTGKDKY